MTRVLIVYDGADHKEAAAIDEVFQTQKDLRGLERIGPHAYLVNSVNSTMQAIRKIQSKVRVGKLTWMFVESGAIRRWPA